MFGLLRAAFTLLICIVLVGFFLGWFTFSRPAADPQSNKVNINVSLDKTKIGSDLQRFEQNVHNGIQDFQNPPPGGNPPPQQQQPGQPLGAPPRFSLGPILTPGGQTSGQQSAVPSLSLGPITIQPSASPTSPAAPLYPPPSLQSQTPNYQFSVPLAPPPLGEGR